MAAATGFSAVSFAAESDTFSEADPTSTEGCGFCISLGGVCDALCRAFVSFRRPSDSRIKKLLKEIERAFVSLLKSR